MAGSPALLIATLANAMLAGFLLALPQALRPALLARREFATPFAFALPTAVRILLVPLMLATALLIDKWVVGTVLVAGALLAALALATVERGGALTNFASFLGTTAMLAGGAAALFNATLVMMPQTFFPGLAARSVNLGFVAIGLGALAAPLVLQLALPRLEMNKTLLLLAFLCLIPAACVALTPSKQFILESTPAERDDGRTLLTVLAAALAFPLDAFLGPWVRRFVSENVYLPGSALLLNGGFWIAFLGSRLAAALFFPEAWAAWAVLLMAMLAAITLGNLSGAYAPGSAGAALLATGICCGPLVPTLLGLILQSNGAEGGWVLGLVNAAGALSMVLAFPWVDASRPGRTTQGVMKAAMALAVLLMAVALVLALTG